MSELLPPAVLRAVQRLTGEEGAPEEEDLTLLSQWLDDAVASEQSALVDELLLQTLPDTTERRQLRYLVQARAGRQVLRKGGHEQVVQVFGIPLFLEQAQVPPSASGPLEALSIAQEVSSTLEYALELPAGSIELAQHLCDVDEAYALNAVDWRYLGRELLATGDTSPVPTARLADRARTGVLWLGAVQVPREQEEFVYEAFGKVNAQRPAMAAYRHRSAELLERDFRAAGRTVSAQLYMPVLLPQLFAAFRSLELNLLIADAVRPHRSQAKSLGFEQDVRNLRVQVLDAKGQALGNLRVQIAELSDADVQRLVVGSARRLGLTARAL
jgi:hypothetical protein